MSLPLTTVHDAVAATIEIVSAQTVPVGFKVDDFGLSWKKKSSSLFSALLSSSGLQKVVVYLELKPQPGAGWT